MSQWFTRNYSLEYKLVLVVKTDNESKFHCLIKNNLTDCSNPIFNGVHVFWVSRDLSMRTFLILEWGEILVVAFKL